MNNTNNETTIDSDKFNSNNSNDKHFNFNFSSILQDSGENVLNNNNLLSKITPSNNDMNYINNQGHLNDSNSKKKKEGHNKGDKKPKKKSHMIVQKESKEYEIDLANLSSKKWTTLMIRNIPNKYTQDLMLQSINQNFNSQYDFFYLPIDFKNKCNVGYAFINFLTIDFIKPFYEQYDSKKWDKFNSDKICKINYARIQGKEMLLKHFQNSSVMNNQVDVKYKPLLSPN